MGRIMTVNDVADYLRVKPRVIYRLVRNGVIPMAKLPTQYGTGKNGHYRINSDVLDRWLTARMWANLKKEGLCQ